MKTETQTFYEAIVQVAVAQIASQLDAPLQLNQLARRAALSPLHFHRIFQGMVGETANELHRRLRLERAALALLREALPITQLAFQAGYESHEAFTRSFRARYGSSPLGFRQAAERAPEGCHGSVRWELAAPSGIHFAANGAVPPIRAASRRQIMNVEIEQRPGLRLFAAPHIGPYNQISEAFARLGEIVGKAGLVGRPGCEMIAVYRDDPESTPPAELRSDAAISVDEAEVLPEGLVELRLPGGPYARTTHVGSYRTLGDTWAQLMGQWLPHSGLRVSDGLSYERYRNTPMDTAEAELRTDLFVPLTELPS